MKKLILFFIVLILAVFLGSLMYLDPGYVLISYKTWTIETTLWAMILAILVIYLILHFISSLWRGTRSLTRHVQRWSKQKNMEKSRNLANNGVILWQEGKLPQAERQLIKAAKYNAASFIDYVIAAHIAQQQKQYHKRDAYLHRAQKSAKGSETAINLTKVRFQLEANQLEQALATLMHVMKSAPRHPYVLKLLTQTYTQLHEWRKLQLLLPKLHKLKAIPIAELEQIEQLTYIALLASTQDAEALNKIWETIPRQLQKNHELILAYAKTALQYPEQHPEIEKLLRSTLNRSWDLRFLSIYARIDNTASCLSKHLKTTENWLKQHDDPVLFLCLGQVCKKLQLWGKAKKYLETSLSLDQNNSIAYCELGQLQETMGNQNAALENYRKGCQV